MKKMRSPKGRIGSILLLCLIVSLFSAKLTFGKGIKGGKLFAYVGGINEVAKVDMQTYNVSTNSSSFPGGIVFGVQISPDGKEIYVTGDMFSVPFIVLDSKSLQITKKLSKEGFEGFEYDKTGHFASRGKLSPDGSRFAMGFVTDTSMPFCLIDTATLSVIDKPREFQTNPIYQAVFSDDSKLLYIVTPYHYVQGKVIYENKIVILESETGKILKQVPLPDFKKIPCQTNISKYIRGKSDVYISCYENENVARGLLKANSVHPFIARVNFPKIEIIEVKTGKVIDELPLPGGEINTVTLTPDGKKLLVGGGAYRHPGELTIIDVKSKKMIKAISFEGGAATSNIVFGYE